MNAPVSPPPLLGKPARKRPLIWLKADGAADSTDVIELLETLRESGVERLKLLTIPAAVDNAG